MKIIRDPEQFQRFCLRVKRQGKSLGLVPTMGYLHEGHLSLVRRARKENQITVLSIFVNPAQFGPKEDFARYPRDEKRDLRLCRREKVDCVFLPAREKMYAPDYETYVLPGKSASGLCGDLRPGHFQGVATVVAKLFNLALPERAYFGQKDYQQSLLMRRMVRDLNFPVRVIICPIARDPDGLAMSSRNTYLNAAARARALVIPRTLGWMKDQIEQGEKNAARLTAAGKKRLKTGLRKVDYLAVLDAETLLPVRKISGKIAIVCAGYAGKVRLLDNLVLRAGKKKR